MDHNKRLNGLFLLNEQITALEKYVLVKDAPNRIEHIKSKKDRADSTILTLFTVDLISMVELEILRSYIQDLAKDRLTPYIIGEANKILEEVRK